MLSSLSAERFQHGPVVNFWRSPEPTPLSSSYTHVLFPSLQRAGIMASGDSSLQKNLTLYDVCACFFLVRPKDDEGEHLRTLPPLANRTDAEQSLVEWCAATDEQEVKESLLHHERYLTSHLPPATNTEAFIGLRISVERTASLTK